MLYISHFSHPMCPCCPSDCCSSPHRSFAPFISFNSSPCSLSTFPTETPSWSLRMTYQRHNIPMCTWCLLPPSFSLLLLSVFLALISCRLFFLFFTNSPHRPRVKSQTHICMQCVRKDVRLLCTAVEWDTGQEKKMILHPLSQEQYDYP